MKAKKINSKKYPTATEVKTKFGSFLMKAHIEPVIFSKNEKKDQKEITPAGVLISFEQFQKYQELEDLYWTERAKTEGKEMLGTKKSKELLDSI